MIVNCKNWAICMCESERGSTTKESSVDAVGPEGKKTPDIEYMPEQAVVH